MPAIYPLDLTGSSPANLVTNEIHVSDDNYYKDYYFIIPECAPFFITNFKAWKVVGGTSTLLSEGVDFSFVLSYVTGTRSTGVAMYGGIVLHNIPPATTIRIEYQTIGGPEVLDRTNVINHIANKVYNPIITIWDVILDVPPAFPPVPHEHDYNSLKGQEDLIASVNDLVNAVANNGHVTASVIQDFITLLNVTTITGINTGSLNASAVVLKSGSTMTGPLKLPNLTSGSANADAANKKYVDDKIAALRLELGLP